jgi:aquaporin Z
MIKQLLVEFLGTLVFLYVILATGNFAAIGATLALVIYLGGPISGGNFNPAVTVMMVAAKKQNMDTLLYILAQIAGGLVALQLFKQFKLPKLF